MLLAYSRPTSLATYTTWARRAPCTVARFTGRGMTRNPVRMDCEDSGGGTGDTSTYQVLAAQDSYPKQICQFDEPSLSIPFIPLSGEYAQFVGRTSEGLIALSNYRVFLQQRDATYHIPLGVIEAVECREIFFLYLLCKDTKSYKCTFPTSEQCAEWQRRLTKALSLPQRLENVFAFAFYMWNMEEARDLHSALIEPEGQQSYAARAEKMFDEEVRRLGFDLGGAWRISVANVDFQLCPTYPKKLVVPASINDNVLDFVARFRAVRRIPAVVWRHSNGAVIARCSQPEVGWLGWRSSEDEDLVKAISEACAYDSPISSSNGIGTTATQLVPPNDSDKEAVTPSSDIPSLCDLPEAKSQADIKKVLIVDARSYATAVANRARGGGCECPEYYPQCEIQFMNLANIHTIRKSHHALRQLASSSPDIPNWLSLLENSRWLGHLSGLFKAAVTIVQAVEREARPVLVHCSDGWDRTPQLTALAQLLLDPYYRTIHGFVVLIEREWVEFGHKFSDRCGIGRCCEDVNERCPVFLQWLDCVHHLLYWYPTAFQFNQAFLVKLAQHVYSNLFGTFLCNSSQERVQADIGDRSYSVWAFLKVNSQRYTNYLYVPMQQVLYPSCHVKDLRLWTSVYMAEMGEVTADTSTSAHPSVGDDEDEEEEIASGGGELVKTKSYDDLLAGTSPPPHQLLRRSSDPNIRESGPNMAMLNSALGAELRNEESETAVENASEDAASEDFDAYEDSNSEPIGERQNDESESLTLCEPSVSESEIHECVSIVQNDPCDIGVESGEEASELLGQECVELQEKCIIKVTDSKRDTNGEKLHNGKGTSSDRQFKTLAEQSIEGSTDTLVAEMGIIATEDKVSQDKNSEHTPMLNKDGGQNSPKSILQGKCCPFMTGAFGDENEVCAASNNRKAQKQSVSSNPDNSIEDRAEKRTVNSVPNMSSVMHSVAASGCNICLQSKKLLDETSAGDSWRSAGLMNEGSVGGGAVRGVTTGPGSRVSLYSTPMHSRTPSSCIPSTPCEDRFGGGGDSSRSSNYSTIDGLHNVSDEVTKRLHQILLHHQSEKESLKRDLQATRHALYNQIQHNRCHSHHHDGTEDQMSLPESVGSGSGGSVGQESGVSDTSWEAVEEGEARPTLWVPDHAVDACTGCNTQFWMGRRKHHCRLVARSCGKIFCSDCSEHSIPIPREQLYQPVRVCGACFYNLGVEHTKPKIVAAASN